MILKSKKEIVEYLKSTGACESQLCEICEEEAVYFTVYPDVDCMIGSALDGMSFYDEYEALTIVKCSEGFISIPVVAFDRHAGFEQFDLEAIEDIDRELVQYYYEKTINKANLIKTLID